MWRDGGRAQLSPSCPAAPQGSVPCRVLEPQCPPLGAGPGPAPRCHGSQRSRAGRAAAVRSRSTSGASSRAGELHKLLHRSFSSSPLCLARHGQSEARPGLGGASLSFASGSRGKALRPGLLRPGPLPVPAPLPSLPAALTLALAGQPHPVRVVAARHRHQQQQQQQRGGRWEDAAPARRAVARNESVPWCAGSCGCGTGESLSPRSVLASRCL